MEKIQRLRDGRIFHFVRLIVIVNLFSQLELLRADDVLLQPGSIKGNFQVSFTGAATYLIPIRVSPGTGGMQPALSIDYNSQSSQSIVGKGWTIGGISQISRGAKNLLNDGLVSGINLDKSDACCIPSILIKTSSM